MEATMKRLRCYLMLLLVMASVLMGVCQAPKTGFSADTTALNFYFNDDPSVYAYTGQTRAVSATVQISIVVDGTFIPGVHTHPSWTVSISGPDPNNPQQTTTVGSATFTHPGPYTNANVSITLPAAAGTYTYTASLTGGEGTASPVSDSARIVAISSLEYKIGTADFTAVPGTLYVAKGTTVTFKAIPNPAGAWPSGKPVWGGTAGATGTGETNSVTFNTAGTFTVTAECGNTVIANVTVVEVSKLQYHNGTAYVDVPNPLYVAKGSEITFKAISNPAGGWPSGKPVWGGTVGASGTDETKAVTFDTGSTTPTDYKTVTATCGNVKTANVVVVDDTTPPEIFEIALFGDAVVPFVIDPYWDDIAYIGFRAEDDQEEFIDTVEVTLEIKSGDEVVRTLCYEEWLDIGVEYWTEWDGTDDDGYIVEDGDYDVVLTVRDFCGNEVVGTSTIGVWEW